MIGNIGPAGFILILVVALILFGPNKLPEGWGERPEEHCVNLKSPSPPHPQDKKESTEEEQQSPNLLKK